MLNSEPEWLHNEVTFHSEKLQNIVDELKRKYNLDIALKANSKQLFTGTLPLTNIDEALQILSSTYHLKTIKENGRIILVAVNEDQ